MLVGILGISPHVINSTLGTWGYAAVFLFLAIEASGVPFPGETMLLTAAAYAGAGHLKIGLVIAAAALGAISGDNLGYLIGRTGGRGIILRYGRYIRLDERKLASAQRYYRSHGDKTVFIGRFIAVLRSWSGFLAGLNGMPWRKFVLFDVAGAIVWSTMWGVLAYTLGRNLNLLHRVISYIGIAGIALVVAGALLLLILRHKRKGRETAEDSVGEVPSESDAAGIS